MASETYKVSGEVTSICGKCKKDTTHVIVALVDEKPKRVECLACHAVHNYRKPKSETATKKTPKKRATSRKKLDLPEEDAVDYSPKGKYQLEQVLRHKTFGLGLITRVEQTKIEVMFENKVTRKLILTYTPPPEPEGK